MTVESKIRKLVGCEGVPGQGPYMLIVIEAESDRIVGAKFQTYGCPAAQACGQFATEWVEGKTFEEAAQFSTYDFITGIGQMPLGREHCPGLTVGALKRCLVSEDVSQQQ